MLFAFGHTVVFKTPHNVFFRRFRRVRKMDLIVRHDGEETAYLLTFMRGGTVEIPTLGTIIRFGRKIAMPGLETVK